MTSLITLKIMYIVWGELVEQGKISLEDSSIFVYLLTLLYAGEKERLCHFLHGIIGVGLVS